MLRALCAVCGLAIIVVNAQGSVVTFVARWGGISKDIPSAMVKDGRRGVFVVGTTYSYDFPTTTAGQAPDQNWCVYGTKLESERGALVYSSVACGQGMTWGRAATLSATGELWVAGNTDGPGFPVTRAAAQARFGGQGALHGPGDAFLLRWDAGGRLGYATYLGGSGDEQANAVATDPAGRIWIAGSTTSGRFSSALSISKPQPFGGADAFLARMNDGGQLAHLERFGGAGNEEITAMSRVGSNRLVLVGHTTSLGGTLGGQPRGGADGFVLLFDTSNYSVVWQRRLGGRGRDQLNAVTVLPDGRVVAVGETDSPDCSNASGKQNGWVVALSATGLPVREFCFGGQESESVRGMTTDAKGNIWVTGVTNSPDFAEQDAPAEARAFAGYRQAFLASLDIDNRSVRSVALLGPDDGPRHLYSEGRAIEAIGDRVLIAGDGGGQHVGRIPQPGGRIVPTPGAFGHDEDSAGHDSFVVALRPSP